MATPETQTSHQHAVPPGWSKLWHLLTTGNAAPRNGKKGAAQETAGRTHDFIVGTTTRDQRHATLLHIEKNSVIDPARLMALEPGWRRIITDDDPFSSWTRHRMLYNDPSKGLVGVQILRSKSSESIGWKDYSNWDISYAKHPGDLFDQSHELIVTKTDCVMVEIGPKTAIGGPQPDLRDPYTRQYNQVLAAVEAQDKNLANHARQAHIRQAALLAAEAALGS